MISMVLELQVFCSGDTVKKRHAEATRDEVKVRGAWVAGCRQGHA